MGDFKRRESRSGGRFNRQRQFSRGRFDERDSGSSRFGGRDSSERESFEATCDKCGRQCSLPFKPTSGKPVYCSDCFRQKDRSETRGDPSQSVELEKINEKLDKILRALHID